MGVGTFFHHIGTFCLFAATILLLISDISAPVVNNLSMLRVYYGNSDQQHTFGTFGFCLLNVNGGGDNCSSKKVGYNPAYEIRQVDRNVDFSGAGEDTSKALTRVMVLHPVATVLAFIAFLLAIGRGTALNFMSSILSGLTFIVTLVVLATDFAGWSIVHRAVNNSDNTASYGPAIWCVLGALIATFLSTILIFLTCCAGRRKNKNLDTAPASTKASRFGRFSRRKEKNAALGANM